MSRNIQEENNYIKELLESILTRKLKITVIASNANSKFSRKIGIKLDLTKDDISVHSSVLLPDKKAFYKLDSAEENSVEDRAQYTYRLQTELPRYFPAFCKTEDYTPVIEAILANSPELRKKVAIHTAIKQIIGNGTKAPSQKDFNNIIELLKEDKEFNKEEQTKIDDFQQKFLEGDWDSIKPEFTKTDSQTFIGKRIKEDIEKLLLKNPIFCKMVYEYNRQTIEAKKQLDQKIINNTENYQQDIETFLQQHPEYNQTQNIFCNYNKSKDSSRSAMISNRSQQQLNADLEKGAMLYEAAVLYEEVKKNEEETKGNNHIVDQDRLSQIMAKIKEMEEMKENIETNLANNGFNSDSCNVTISNQKGFERVNISYTPQQLKTGTFRNIRLANLFITPTNLKTPGQVLSSMGFKKNSSYTKTKYLKSSYKEVYSVRLEDWKKVRSKKSSIEGHKGVNKNIEKKIQQFRDFTKNIKESQEGHIKTFNPQQQSNKNDYQEQKEVKENSQTRSESTKRKAIYEQTKSFELFSLLRKSLEENLKEEAQDEASLEKEIEENFQAQRQLEELKQSLLSSLTSYNLAHIHNAINGHFSKKLLQLTNDQQNQLVLKVLIFVLKQGSSYYNLVDNSNNYLKENKKLLVLNHTFQLLLVLQVDLGITILTEDQQSKLNGLVSSIEELKTDHEDFLEKLETFKTKQLEDQKVEETDESQERGNKGERTASPSTNNVVILSFEKLKELKLKEWIFETFVWSFGDSKDSEDNENFNVVIEKDLLISYLEFKKTKKEQENNFFDQIKQTFNSLSETIIGNKFFQTEVGRIEEIIKSISSDNNQTINTFAVDPHNKEIFGFVAKVLMLEDQKQRQENDESDEEQETKSQNNCSDEENQTNYDKNSQKFLKISANSKERVISHWSTSNDDNNTNSSNAQTPLLSVEYPGEGFPEWFLDKMEEELTLEEQLQKGLHKVKEEVSKFCDELQKNYNKFLGEIFSSEIQSNQNNPQSNNQNNQQNAESKTTKIDIEINKIKQLVKESGRFSTIQEEIKNVLGNYNQKQESKQNTSDQQATI